MTSKDERLAHFRQYLHHMSNLVGTNMRCCYFHSDKGTDFTGGNMPEVMKFEGIECQFTPLDTPQ